MNTRASDSCRELLDMKILPMDSQYIYQLILYTVNNEHLRNTDKEIHKLLICDKSVTTQNLAFLSYWYRKKCLHMHF